MKALLTSVFVLGLIFIAQASADPDPAAKESLMAVTSVEANDEKVSVSFKVPVGKVTISILNEQDKILAHNRYNAKTPMNIPYDLSDLPEGYYSVKIKTKEEVAIYSVETKEKEKVFERPIVAFGKVVDNHTINLTVLGIEKPGTQVDIFDESNQVIATDKVKVKDGFERDYRVSNRKVEGLYIRIKDAQGRKKYIYF
ncbi:DUF3244 domain-containing protein [Echinicola marina]|uniref:DUF3244 domain-containing protein n=1 Tax=Echinicola marina TaxID=2859768 RepID=UPI001CF6B729|nr:DUF3244 domain-containing protein [Echinicola marina]UCS95076.1 DUF3244 domain-containing protein [Echinicola marina]